MRKEEIEKKEKFCKGIWKKCDQRRRGKRMLLRKKEKNKRGVTKEEVNFSERQNSEDLRILFREFLADRKVEGKARAERIDEMHRGWTIRTNFSI